MYQELMTALDEAGKNDACVVAVLTGSGEYYCSGNDLGNFTRIPPEGPQKMANDARKVLKYVSSSMSFPVSQIPQSFVYLWATSFLQKNQGWFSLRGAEAVKNSSKQLKIHFFVIHWLF